MAVQGHVASRSGTFVIVRTRNIVAAFLPLLVIAVLACSSGDPATPPPTATLAVGQTPSPAESPTPTTASPTPTPLPIYTIDLPPCDPGGQNSSGIQLGTAPGPTPTPLPEAGQRDASVISQELSDYFASASPVAEHLAEWSESFNSVWSSDLTGTQEADLLQVLGTRAAQACDAVRQITHLPPEVTGFDSLLRQAARTRHAWVGVAAEQLECCGAASSSVIDVGNIETSDVVDQLAVESASLLERYNSQPAEPPVLVDEAFGIEILPRRGWLTAADGLNPVLFAPFELNRITVSGLGPDRWQQGTAVRVRRLRNPETLDAETASSRFIALITQQGSVSSVETVEVDGVPAARHILAPEDPRWSATITVFVAGDFTYFLETGCPSEVDGACDATNAVATSLKLIP